MEAAVGVHAPLGGASEQQMQAFRVKVGEYWQQHKSPAKKMGVWTLLPKSLPDQTRDCVVAFERENVQPGEIPNHCVNRLADGRCLDFQKSDQGEVVTAEVQTARDANKIVYCWWFEDARWGSPEKSSDEE
jgi:hypothetical protein